MSMCFYHKGIVYADRFQITDYKRYVGTLTDQKIMVSKKKNIVFVAMGKVPEDKDELFAKLERFKLLFEKSIPAVKKENTIDEKTILENLRSLQIVGMVFFLNKDYVYGLICHAVGKKQQEMVAINHRESAVMYAPHNIIEILEMGKTPAEVFRATSLCMSTVSKEYTAYDIVGRKFLNTNF